MIGCYACGEVPGGRDRIIREMVGHTIAASDAGRDLLELISEFKSAPDKEKAAGVHIAMLLDLHARLVRLGAEDENDVHNILNGRGRHVAELAEKVPA